MAEKKLQISQEDIMQLLDKLYDNSIKGLPKVSPPIENLAADYLSKNPDKETVLTPWRVVNMHMSQTLGGYCFYDETFQNLNKVSLPILDENGDVVKDELGKAKNV